MKVRSSASFYSEIPLPTPLTPREACAPSHPCAYPQRVLMLPKSRKFVLLFFSNAQDCFTQADQLLPDVAVFNEVKVDHDNSLELLRGLRLALLGSQALAYSCRSCLG